MAAKKHLLVYDLGPDEGPARETKATHSSLEDAKAQAELDIEHGRRVLRIETLEGEVVWAPE